MSDPITADQLRQSFLDFFEAKDHTVVPSASLIAEDPTLLLVNGGNSGLEVPGCARLSRDGNSAGESKSSQPSMAPSPVTGTTKSSRARVAAT